MSNIESKNSEKKKIMVAEDDKFLVKVYQLKFDKEGFDVAIANDGMEAISLIESGYVPNIVLLDLMLPIVNGFEVLSAIKKKDKWKKVPVLILSNLGQDSDIKKAKDLGAVEYIIKSNSKINDIVDKVRQYLK